MIRVSAMEPVPNPLLASTREFSPVPNPLLPGAKDKAPVPDPLSSFAYDGNSNYNNNNMNEVGRDMSPSSTMLQLNHHFAGGDSAAFISDEGGSMLFLSDYEPTNVLNNTDPTYQQYPDSDDREALGFPFPSSVAPCSPGCGSATIPATPPLRESKASSEVYPYSSNVIVDDDSSKEGRLSPGGEAASCGEESSSSPGTTTTTMTTTTVPGVVKSKKRKYRTGNDARMNEQRKVERRERNREHAKKSRIRKKSFMESMQQAAALLREENARIRSAIHQRLGDGPAQEILKAKFAGPNVDGKHASPVLEGSRCSEAVVASARELAVKVAMNNLKELSSVGGEGSGSGSASLGGG